MFKGGVVHLEKNIRNNQLDPQFKYRIANKPGGESLFNCFACGKCSAVCPISEINEAFKPRKIIYMILLGMKEEILSNEFIWLCATCDACSFRCPQEVRMADIMGVVREIAEDEGYAPSGFNQQIEVVKVFSKLYELNAKYALWEEIKNTISNDREKPKKGTSFSYLDEFELCIDLSFDFIKKYPQSCLLSNVLDFIDNRFRLYFWEIGVFSKIKIEEKEEIFRVLLKYECLIENFTSPYLKDLIIKNMKNIVEVYNSLGEKDKSDSLIQKVEERFPESSINLEMGEE